ncbi:RNA polymerase sigma factor [Pseudomonas stutzeri]|uniref:RNA polymerase sigma factor n=1 Tax=Stutzerimonas stutzeri TaxID=316 RepID=UPI001F525F0C|nr:RNA polymerase sigma factor [Stutzerimonas stutzeri]MCI0917938.1 RNA polymerase sigma factor [Stutzerimonas stutzeri]
MSAGSTHQQLVGSLYRDHREWLLSWLRRHQPCSHRAEDLSQDTFVRLLKRNDLSNLREPRTLLATIARGLLIDHFRRSTLERAYLDELALQPEELQPGAEEQLQVLQALREVNRMLGELSGNARAAFIYNRLDGLTHAEIASRLGVSVPRVRQYLAQALRQCYIAVYGEPK